MDGKTCFELTFVKISKTSQKNRGKLARLWYNKENMQPVSAALIDTEGVFYDEN